MDKDELLSNIFIECVTAIENNVLIERSNADDKEFHFQNWVRDRLKNIGAKFTAPGRNTYPDFKMDHYKLGFEVKGLEFPGREASYDGNSQSPKGLHNGRTIYYIFGRYPKVRATNRYPVYDLIICPGSFLNADSDYEHKNQPAKGFGSYGDILIRDRKMYVIPTPYSLAHGLAKSCTLITPDETVLREPLVCVGDLTRVEASRLLASYNFNLQTNRLTVKERPNPHAGKEHKFKCWQLESHRGGEITMKSLAEINEQLELFSDDDE